MAASVDRSYREMQDFNLLTKWLHSYRYKQIFKSFEKHCAFSDKPVKVLEIGAAYGRLYNLLDSKFDIDYRGVELYPSLLNEAVKQFGDRKNAHFIQGDATTESFWSNLDFQPDIIVALETLEHIPEKAVLFLLEKAGACNPNLFIYSVPVEKGPSILFKNIGSFLAGYTRHKEYTWKETLYAGFNRYYKLPPHDTGHKGFDWQWLLHSCRQYFNIKSITYFPLNFLPSAFATSVYVEAEPLKQASS